MKQSGFFDLDDRLKALSAKGGGVLPMIRC